MRNARKEIGKYLGTFTSRGKLSENDSEQGAQARIRLFDGVFDTGFVIREFYIWGTNWAGSSGPDGIGKLSTSPNVSLVAADFFDAGDAREIAWAVTAGSLDSGASGPFNPSVIDPENLIVEDLWVTIRGLTDTADFNYLIVMDKYDITETLGAVSMARDRANDSETEWRSP